MESGAQAGNAAGKIRVNSIPDPDARDPAVNRSVLVTTGGDRGAATCLWNGMEWCKRDRRGSKPFFNRWRSRWGACQA